MNFSLIFLSVVGIFTLLFGILHFCHYEKASITFGILALALWAGLFLYDAFAPPSTCPSCEAIYEAGDKYCAECGVQLTPKE